MGEKAESPLTERIEAALREHERRTRSGEQLDLDDYCAAYPELAPHLRRELAMHTMLGELTTRPVLEQIGAELGDYRLVEEIGRGGMGAVFRARDSTLDRDVAVKVVAIDPLRPERAERLLREARAIARIRHPHVVEVYAFGRTDRWLYLVMELLEGTVAERAATLAAAERSDVARRWMTEAAEGIAHCHAQNIIHRDLKPENLLLDAHGSVKVADFGLARADDLARVTETGHVLGTLGYAAPELLRGDSADVRTDVYGLGACLYALVVGRPPGRDPAPWRTLPADTPRALRSALARALAPEPSERLADAASFIAALAAEEPAPSAGRRARAAILLGVGALAATVGVAWMRTERVATPAPPAVTTASAVDAPPPAGGFVMDSLERWLAESESPAEEARGPGATPGTISALWERKLAELSTGRELSRARAVEFEDGGLTYVAEVNNGSDHVEVALTSEGVVRARMRLSLGDLPGRSDGWGIYFETTDEDGDGRKELVLVRVGEALASIRIIKWDPQAWIGGGTGWRRPAPPDARYGEPTLVERAGGLRVETLVQRAGASELAAFALDTGARDGPALSVPWLRPAAPRVLGTGTELWLEIGHAHAIVLPPESASWRWHSGTADLTRIDSWRALHLAGDDWVAVGRGDRDLAFAGLRADALAAVTSDPHARRLLEASPPGVVTRDAKVCTVGAGTVACVSPPRAGSEPTVRWQTALPPGTDVVQPPVEIADIDGDGLGELAIASAAGRLLIISARGGGTIIAERDLEIAPGDKLLPVSPLLWVDSLRCLVVVGATRVGCATVSADRIDVRSVAEVESPWDVHTSGHLVEAGTGATARPLIALTLTTKQVQLLDPAAPAGSDARVWRYATATEPMRDISTARRDGQLWIAFADVAGSLYALPVPLPAGAAID